jgi:hypothetical protein
MWVVRLCGVDVRRDVEQKLARVDRESNLGLDWVEGRWFVFDMTLKAQVLLQHTKDMPRKYGPYD